MVADKIGFQPGDVVRKGALPLLVVGIRVGSYLCLSFRFHPGEKFPDSLQYCYPAGELRLADAITKLIVYRNAMRAAGRKRNFLPRSVHEKIVTTLREEAR